MTAPNHMTPTVTGADIPTVFEVHFPNRHEFPAVLVESVEDYIAFRLCTSMNDTVIVHQEDVCMIAALTLRRHCACGNEYPIEMWATLMADLCQVNVDIPFTCWNTQCALEYMMYENRCPSSAELTSFQDRLSRFAQDADEYTREDQVVCDFTDMKWSPTINERSGEETCTLCQGGINSGQLIYELPCKHIFHAQVSECLENMTILDWFRSHRRCPNCNEEIVHTNSVAPRS